MSIASDIRNAQAALADGIKAVETSLSVKNIANMRKAVELAQEVLKSVVKGNYEISGCTCETHDDGDRIVNYPDEKCRHHGYYHQQLKKMEEDYKARSKKLEQPIRIQFLQAALGGILASNSSGSERSIADRCGVLADLMIERLKKE